jgi:hypothetical protein
VETKEIGGAKLRARRRSILFNAADIGGWGEGPARQHVEEKGGSGMAWRVDREGGGRQQQPTRGGSCGLRGARDDAGETEREGERRVWRVSRPTGWGPSGQGEGGKKRRALTHGPGHSVAQFKTVSNRFK